MIRLLILCCAIIACGCDVDVSLEARESGFFLRPAEPGEEEEGARRFALLSSAPAALRAQFGPLVARATASAAPPPNATSGDARVERLLSDVTVSARLVTREVRRDRPELRVLFFHHGARGGGGGEGSAGKRRPPPSPGVESEKGLCFVLYVQRRDEHLMATCRPNAGACLAQAALPAAWWAPLADDAPAPLGKPRREWLRLRYAVLQGASLECGDSSALPVSVPGGLPGLPLEEEAALSPGHGSYEEVRGDEAVRLLVPQGPVYPRSKVYVPVTLRPDPVYPPYVFVIRARVKSGLRILGAQVSAGSPWSISVESNPRQTMATVTAFVKDTATKPPLHTNGDSAAETVFTWLFEVEEGGGSGAADAGRITWQLRYMLDSSMAEQFHFDDEGPKLTSRLDIRKDEVQAVVPVAKSSQLLNTAVLTGRQVSQPMKVFVVSQAGKVGDVTLQSSCHSADESILKVSPSCTSVYLDGSEVRGSQNASVLVRFGAAAGHAHFRVWMPELPLSLRLSDARLSQLKGWRTPHRGKMTSSIRSGVDHRSPFSLSKSDRWIDNDGSGSAAACRLRHQQSRVDVFTRFLSVAHESGRESHLLGRRAELRITELVAPFLRVADARVARLIGATLRGLQPGRTEVQVLSPITGRVIGAKEVRVGTDKETITHLEVSVVTGLQLSVTPDENMPGVFVSRTAISHKLVSQYQEGLLDIRIHFSDSTWTSLSDIEEGDFHLSVDTFDSGVVAFAPMAGLHHPRVIAIGQGKGDLLHVTLELADQCQKRRSQPLAMAYAFVDVDFSKEKSLLNDVRTKGAKGEAGKKRLDKVDSFVGGGKDPFLGSNDAGSVPYQDAIGHRGKSHYHEPAVQARQNLVHPSDLTPLEIGMYALLGVFCLAILVFLVSCSVFAVRYRRKQIPPIEQTTSSVGGDSVAHAHDWVWLGRATLERNSVNTRCSQTLLPMADFNGNHPDTTLKIQRREKGVSGRPVGAGCRGSNLSFPGSEISIRITTNPQEMTEEALLAEKPSPPVNSATVSRGKRVRIVTVPPPLPPGNALKQLPPPAHPPPPIPPHRHFPAPPVPPHQRQRPFPRAFANDAEWESVAQGMDYDQLIEYFENLKESNA